MKYHMRVARPVGCLETSKKMYCEGLGLSEIYSFVNHNGFDGIMLGNEDMDYHFEFTVCRNHVVVPSPTVDDLIVLYIKEIEEWKIRRDKMKEAGFIVVPSFNPYWDISGITFQDVDGYRVVLQQGEWQNKVSKHVKLRFGNKLGRRTGTDGPLRFYSSVQTNTNTWRTK